LKNGGARKQQSCIARNIDIVEGISQIERSTVMKGKMINVLAVLLVIGLAVSTSVGVASAQGDGTTLADGFNAPQGVLVAPDGSVWVIDSGVGGETEISAVDPNTGEETMATLGETARVVQVAADGTQTVAANLPSVLVGMESIGGARLALLDGSLYATSGGWMETSGDTPAAPTIAAVVKVEGDEVTVVASTWEREAADNPGGFIKDSHPYGITAGPDGNLWVADAGANTLLKIDPSSGEVDVVAVFDGVASPLPNAARGDAMESDPVPTAVAFDAAGEMYVSFLPGFPFLPGSAKVVKVSQSGQVSDYAMGLTMVTDLRVGPDGEMYAVQIGQFTEQGPVPDSGAIIRIKEGDASEVVASGLSFPTSIDFNSDGDAYVTTNGVGAPGTGAVIVLSGLTDQVGQPLGAGGAAAAEESAEAEAPAEEAVAEEAAEPSGLPTSGGAGADVGWWIAIVAASSLALVAGGMLLSRDRSQAGDSQ
jgi:hypothetical protein